MTSKPKAIEYTPAAAVEAVTAAPAKTFEKAVETMKQTTAAATENMEKAQTTMKEGVTRAMKTAEQFTTFSQGNMEALMKSSQILATGFQEMSKLMAATAKANLDETMSTFKAISTAKSVKEAFDLQSSFAKASMEKAMAESGKITEHSLRLVEQAYAPISARVNVAVETFTTQA